MTSRTPPDEGPAWFGASCSQRFGNAVLTRRLLGSVARVVDMAVSDEIEAFAYVIDALRRQEIRYRGSNLPVPASVPDLVASVGFRVTRGQGGTTSARASQLGHGQTVQSLLVTYEEAAVLIGISVRTVKRRVSTGHLEPVRDGGVVRLRRADVEAYVDGLGPRDGA